MVRIYDLGEAGGVKFITMEHVDGEDLKTILRRSHKLPPVEAVNIMQQVCRALAIRRPNPSSWQPPRLTRPIRSMPLTNTLWHNWASLAAITALQFDPEMGRAYVVLAVVYHNMKQPQQAEKYFKLALSKIDHMSDREKYRTRGTYYLVAREPERALEELQQLVAKYPADNAGIGNLALAYFFRRDMARALEVGGRAAGLYPKNTIYRNNVGLYAMYAGDFDAAILEQRRALGLNQNLVLGYVGTAVPQLALAHPEDAIATYHQLEKLGPDGVSAAAAGLADVALYQGRLADAIKILEEGITRDTADKNPDGAAAKLATLSQAQSLAGKASEAGRTAERALAASHEIPIQFWAARTYIGASQEAKALAIVRDLGGRLDADPQAYGKLLEEGLKSSAASDSYKAFSDIKNGGQDPLLSDARRRGQRN